MNTYTTRLKSKVGEKLVSQYFFLLWNIRNESPSKYFSYIILILNPMLSSLHLSCTLTQSSTVREIEIKRARLTVSGIHFFYLSVYLQQIVLSLRI